MQQNGKFMQAKKIEDLNVKIFADGADLENILELDLSLIHI